MISKKDIKDLDFNSFEEYVYYIVDSEINGNRRQVLELIKEMSSPQKKDALDLLGSEELEDAKIVQKLIIKYL